MLSDKQLKQLDYPYRKAIDIFARKLSDDEKKLLLTEMKQKTEIIPRWTEWLRHEMWDEVKEIPAITAALAVPFSLASRKSIRRVLPVAAAIAVGSKLYNLFSNLSDGAEGNFYTDSNTIVLRPYVTKETAFHEAIHFLEGKEIIQDTDEKISTAAEALFCGDTITNMNPEYNEEYQPIKYYCSDHDYDEGWKFAKTVLRLKRKRGEAVAWEFLYRTSQEKTEDDEEDKD